MLTTPSPSLATPRHRVRELVFAYRPLRDNDGHVIDVATLALNTPRIAAATLGPLLRHEPVEVFGVACLSTKHRLLAWHVLSRGTRSSTPVSMPDVFVPACVTPGTTGSDRRSQPPVWRSDAEPGRCAIDGAAVCTPPTCSTSGCSIT